MTKNQSFDTNLIRADYLRFLNEYGFTAEQVERLAFNESDRINLPLNGVEIRASQIHGLGMFATKPFTANQRIMPGRIGDKRTQAGRYPNHSPNPNAKMQIDDDAIYLVAIRDIQPGDEICNNYRQAIDLARSLSN